MSNKGINIDDAVMVVSNESYLESLNGRIGRVLRVYDFNKAAAVVKFENGETAKITLDALVKVSPQKTEEVKSDISESGITITKKDWLETVDKVLLDNFDPVAEKNGKDSFLSSVRAMSAHFVAIQISKDLFNDEGKITVADKREFTSCVWLGCEPHNLQKYTPQMEITKLVSVAMSAYELLLPVIDYIFDESEND